MAGPEGSIFNASAMQIVRKCFVLILQKKINKRNENFTNIWENEND